MHIELLPGLDNVIRFPVERRARPTLELLRGMAPDSREVSLVALSFGLDEPPFDLRDTADRQTAEYILNEVPPEPGAGRMAVLQGMLDGVVTEAVEACRASHDASLAMAALRERAAEAKAAGSLWATQLGERADAQALRWAELVVLAQARCLEAEGASHAVECAIRGEAWAPLDSRATSEWLLSEGRG